MLDIITDIFMFLAGERVRIFFFPHPLDFNFWVSEIRNVMFTVACPDTGLHELIMMCVEKGWVVLGLNINNFDYKFLRTNFYEMGLDFNLHDDLTVDIGLIHKGLNLI